MKRHIPATSQPPKSGFQALAGASARRLFTPSRRHPFSTGRRSPCTGRSSLASASDHDFSVGQWLSPYHERFCPMARSINSNYTSKETRAPKRAARVVQDCPITVRPLERTEERIWRPNQKPHAARLDASASFEQGARASHCASRRFSSSTPSPRQGRRVPVAHQVP